MNREQGYFKLTNMQIKQKANNNFCGVVRIEINVQIFVCLVYFSSSSAGLLLLWFTALPTFTQLTIPCSLTVLTWHVEFFGVEPSTLGLQENSSRNGSTEWSVWCAGANVNECGVQHH